MEGESPFYRNIEDKTGLLWLSATPEMASDYLVMDASVKNKLNLSSIYVLLTLVVFIIALFTFDKKPIN